MGTDTKQDLCFPAVAFLSLSAPSTPGLSSDFPDPEWFCKLLLHFLMWPVNFCIPFSIPYQDIISIFLKMLLYPHSPLTWYLYISFLCHSFWRALWWCRLNIPVGLNELWLLEGTASPREACQAKARTWSPCVAPSQSYLPLAWPDDVWDILHMYPEQTVALIIDHALAHLCIQTLAQAGEARCCTYISFPRESNWPHLFRITVTMESDLSPQRLAMEDKKYILCPLCR